MTTTEIIQILTGFIGSIGFAVLFNIRGKKLVLAALGGFLSWALFIILYKFISNEPVCYFIVSALISVYAEILARILKTPTTTFIITSLIPLIPGGSLYYTMASAFGGSANEFIVKGIYTLQLAAALALGIIVISAVTQFITKIRAK